MRCRDTGKREAEGPNAPIVVVDEGVQTNRVRLYICTVCVARFLRQSLTVPGLRTASTYSMKIEFRDYRAVLREEVGCADQWQPEIPDERARRCLLNLVT